MEWGVLNSEVQIKYAPFLRGFAVSEKKPFCPCNHNARRGGARAHLLLASRPGYAAGWGCEEVQTEIKSSPPDKAPLGLDGIDNSMLRAAGPEFKQVLFMMFNTIWHRDSQPKVWQKSLVQLPS